MYKKQQTNYVLLSGIVVSALLVASLLINNSPFGQKALAQGTAIPNATSKPGNMTTSGKITNHTSGITASQSGMNAVLNAVRNTNATSTATKNIINATEVNKTSAAGNMTNKTG